MNSRSKWTGLLVAIGLLTMTPNNLIAQTDTAPCSTPEASQFDFWIGTWNLTWSDTIKGTNVVTKELGSCVIRENFSDPTGGLMGQSYSVYNSARGIWQQTWVDNQGSYLDFEGGLENDQMILSRSFVGKKGNTVTQRMVFSNIQPNSLEWSWESSLDDGDNWKQVWAIHYERASE